jgi:5-methylcytosine-specific restriction endonuclease McrA
MMCTRCGALFYASPTGGRPRSRCDGCRSNHARVDGTAWRRLRAQVLREEPICYIAGCGWPSTQVDHVTPLKLRPDLALVRENLRGICASHNSSKGARLLETPRQSSPAVAHAWQWFIPSPPDEPYGGCSCGDRNCTAPKIGVLA